MGNEKITINRGDPQPLDCPKCLAKNGYQVSDTLVVNFVDFYFPDGEREGGAYSDYQRLIHEGTRAYCMNCVEILPFKIKK